MRQIWQKWSRKIGASVVGLGLIAASTGVWSASGAPLPRCAVSDNAFYVFRFTEGNPAKVALSSVKVLPSLAPAAPFGQTSVPTGVTPGTVAAGMNPKDGYIYAIRGVSGDTFDAPSPIYYQDFRAFQVLRYGAAGVDNLGVIDASGFQMTGTTPPHSVFDPSPNPNFNAADIDPITGNLMVGLLRTGNYLDGKTRQSRLLRIDITANPPKLLSVLTLSPDIPLDQSGDFAIDADGKYAYGIGYSAPKLPPSVSAPASIFWRADLTTGAVTTVANLPSSSVLALGMAYLAGAAPLATELNSKAGNLPYGGAALLPDGTFAFYANQTADSSFYTSPHPLSSATGKVLNIKADGTILGYLDITPGSDSADATQCLPPLPVVTLSCTPDTLVDAASKVSTCTITSDTAAPTGGLSVALTLPASNPTRYTTTCASPILIKAGEKTAQCTITAVENTVPGDGSATATLALATPAAGAPYTLGTPTSATVTVNNDDDYVANLTCTPTTLVDAPNNVSTCTLTLNGAAPSGGLTVGITPPGASTRYTTTCGTSLTVPQGQTSTTCTITATPNTTPGDGNVNAVVTIKPADGYQVGPNASATVAVNNDDGEVPVTAIPTLSQWALALLSLGLMGGAWRQRRC